MMLRQGMQFLYVSAIVCSLCLFAGPAAAQQTSDGIQYVSTNGSDSNNGFTWSTAKATIQAAINALPTYGGRMTVAQGDYYLSSGIATTVADLEIDCVGGRGTGTSSGSVRIHVPSGAVGFTYNPSGTSTGFAGPAIEGCSFMAESGAVGGIHILRTNYFTIQRVSADGFSGSGNYALYIDGTGDYDSWGVVMNSTFTNSDVGIELYQCSAIRLIANHLTGNTDGSPVAGSIGIYQAAGSAGGSNELSDNDIDQFDTLVRMDRCDNDVLDSDRYEVFITAAIELDASSGYCHGPQVIGGSISNYLNGGGGTGIVVGAGVDKALIIISNIEGVTTTISDSGTGTYIVNN